MSDSLPRLVARTRFFSLMHRLPVNDLDEIAASCWAISIAAVRCAARGEPPLGDLTGSGR